MTRQHAAWGPGGFSVASRRSGCAGNSVITRLHVLNDGDGITEYNPNIEPVYGAIRAIAVANLDSKMQFTDHGYL
jgi:hypothetical protein